MKFAFYVVCLMPVILLITYFSPPIIGHVSIGDTGEAQLDWVAHSTVAILLMTPVIAAIGIARILAAARNGEPYGNMLFSTLLGIAPGCFVIIVFLMRGL